MIFLREQLSIMDIIDMMIRRWWILAIAALSMSIAAFTYTQIFIDPLYRSEGALYVNAQRTQNTDITQGGLAASKSFVDTYKEILSRRTFLARVAADLDNRYTANAIGNMITMQSANDTEILEIKVTGKVPEDVQKICHSVLVQASDELVRVVNAGSVKILDDGQIPTSPISPNVKKNTLMGVLLGVVIGALIVLVLELFDTRIRSREDIINRYDEPLLGEIPELIPAVKKAGASE